MSGNLEARLGTSRLHYNILYNPTVWYYQLTNGLQATLDQPATRNGAWWTLWTSGESEWSRIGIPVQVDSHLHRTGTRLDL